jgi:hypothetical protein
VPFGVVDFVLDVELFTLHVVDCVLIGKGTLVFLMTGLRVQGLDTLGTRKRVLDLESERPPALPADSGPAVLLMYEDGKDARLSCYYISADVEEEPEFKYLEQNVISAFCWVEDGLAYALAANADRDLLFKSGVDRLPADLCGWRQSEDSTGIG